MPTPGTRRSPGPAARDASTQELAARDPDGSAWRREQGPKNRRGRILALDLGEAHVGVAVSDPTRTVARPLTELAARPWEGFVQSLARLIEHYEPVALVVGLAIRENGAIGPEAERQRDIAERLEQHLRVPILMRDERYTTRMAKHTQRLLGRRGARARLREHSLAAAHLLTGFLEELPR